jgi:preprotein translocase subunit SecY
MQENKVAEKERNEKKMKKKEQKIIYTAIIVSVYCAENRNTSRLTTFFSMN